MSAESIDRQVCEIIADQLGLADEEIQLEATLKGDLGADSLDIIELVLALEESFDVEISEDQAQKFLVVQDIVDFLKSKLG
ncbi:MAG: acyl carrier protein [Pseudomonadota bacterium]